MFKMGFVGNENCSFCNHFSETILHLFWECRDVDQFCRALIKWLSEEFQNMFTNWSNKDIIFGNRGMQVSSNIIVLLAKRHMYRCKVRNGLLSLNLFQSELKRYILSEKCYVSASGTMIKFTRKWNSFAALWRT